MASLFGHGNVLSTPVGQLIEKASDGTQASENWALFMEVCDLINETDEGPKDAIRAVKKKLQQNVGKSYPAVMYTLTLLETCVKNCGKRFHLQVANKEFLHDLIKIIGPKNDPPPVVQEKVLSLIQTWADAFRGSSDLKEVEKVYQDLKGKGIEFPMTDLDNLAPIHTPARSAPASEPPPNMIRSQGTCTQPPVLPVQVVSGSVVPSTDQLTKLKSELNLVQGNVRVMGEMLTELNPYNVDTSDLELLQELNRTCRQMQQRVVDLLDQVANEEVTNELLRVNDDLNNVFLRYERFERFRTGQSGQQLAAEPSAATLSQESYLPPSYEQVQASTTPSSVVGNLIDLGEENSNPNCNHLYSQLAGMTLSSAGTNDSLGYINSTASTNPPTPPSAAAQDVEFDMFAQSRQSFDHNKQTLGNLPYLSQQEDQFGGLGQAVTKKSQPKNDEDDDNIEELIDKESDYEEMDKWLAANPSPAASGATSKESDSITSSEFDRFLAERTTITDALPVIPASIASSQLRTNPRQLQKDEEEGNPLFAL